MSYFSPRAERSRSFSGLPAWASQTNQRRPAVFGPSTFPQCPPNFPAFQGLSVELASQLLESRFGESPRRLCRSIVASAPAYCLEIGRLLYNPPTPPGLGPSHCVRLLLGERLMDTPVASSTSTSTPRRGARQWRICRLGASGARSILPRAALRDAVVQGGRLLGSAAVGPHRPERQDRRRVQRHRRAQRAARARDRARDPGGRQGRQAQAAHDRAPACTRRLGRRGRGDQHADRRPGLADHRGRRARSARSPRATSASRWRSKSTAGRSKASSCARRSWSTR